MSSSRRIIAGALRPFAQLRAMTSPAHRVLMYHRIRAVANYDQLSVSPTNFEEHIRCLSGLRVISLDSVCQEVVSGLQGNGIALTFDDGYTDNLTNALPILERHNIRATIFVVTDFCEGSGRHSRYPHESRLHLNRTELRELARHPLIEIGSHTLTHPLLGNLDDRSAELEIGNSRKRLEDLILAPVRYFCYPAGNFTKRDVGYVAAAGYRGAVTVHPGCNRHGQSPYLLNRTEVTDRDRAKDLRAKLIGAYDLPHTLLHWHRLGKFHRLRQRSTHSPKEI
jgi:peptidoglycan/xylan/chitin deacetylase (PgdA/CDA1 family)